MRSELNPLPADASDLHDVLERAKQERFRLIRLTKEVEHKLETFAHANLPPTQQIAQLTDKVLAVDAALDERFGQLQNSEGDLQQKLAQLTKLERSLQRLNDDLGQRLQRIRPAREEADGIIADLQAAAERIITHAEEELSAFEEPLALHLDKLQQTEQSLRQRVDQVQQEAQQTLDSLADAADLAKARVQEAAAPLEQEIAARLEALQQSMHDRVAATVEEALTDAERQAAARIRPVRDRLAKLADPVAQRCEQMFVQAQDKASSVLAAFEQLLDHRLDARVEERLATLDSQLDAQQRQLNKRLLEQEAKLEAMLMQATEARRRDAFTLVQRDREQIEQFIHAQRQEIEQQLVRLDERNRDAADAMDRIQRELNHRLIEQCEQLDAVFEERAHKHTQVVEAVDDIDARLARQKELVEQFSVELDAKLATRAQSFAQQADQRLEQVVEGARKRITQAVMDAMRQADEAAAPFRDSLARRVSEHEGQLQRIDDQAQDLQAQAQRAVADADTRLAARAADLAAHVAAFESQAQDIFARIDARSGQAALELQDALSHKLNDFRKDAAAALAPLQESFSEHVQTLEGQSRSALDATAAAMRQHVAQLKDSAVAMVELLEQQIERRIQSAAPRVHDALADLERQLSARLIEMTTSAQRVADQTEKAIAARLDLARTAESAAVDDDNGDDEDAAQALSELSDSDAPREMEPEIADAQSLNDSMREIASRVQGRKPRHAADAAPQSEAA